MPHSLKIERGSKTKVTDITSHVSLYNNLHTLRIRLQTNEHTFSQRKFHTNVIGILFRYPLM